MKIRSEGPVTVGSVSSAAPTITSTRSARPARSRLARATSACLGSYSSVTTRPCGPAPRASQMVLKPPSVPSSRILRAPMAPASRLKNFPCWTDTAIGGNPAALLDSRAALKDGSSCTTVLSKNASTSLGVGFSVMAPTLAAPDGAAWGVDPIPNESRRLPHTHGGYIVGVRSTRTARVTQREKGELMATYEAGTELTCGHE